ncbi:uncharacterized protein LOC118563656 isoform X2 [Fundulus heteroclitus]|uniref:uncharacterized protein LOC118563656 isoform X2 n=1 Tax=Fundulus heteroclitus TaxID=8078 RepID=UPI00165AF642|nr:uncharacterized protein LOC118563656 isoform X2 [Fundulus heteroclitus]
MVVSCCVIGCTNRYNKHNHKSFYRFPKKPDQRRKLWIAAIKRRTLNGQPWEPADHDRVCHLHFVTEPSTSIHDSCVQKICDLRKETQQLYAELGRLQEENLRLATLLNKQHLEQQVIESDRKLQFHTGIPSVAIFLWLLSFVECVLPTSRVMSSKSVLLCVLMKLRLNLQHQDLAYRFNVSLTTISDILNQGLPRLARKLCFLIQWPEREYLIANMPHIFKVSYPRCSSIIDCFEVFIQRPGKLTARAQTWSNYKHNNTIKFLVSITPTGAISFVSKAFGGRTSDKVITLRSGFLDNIQYGDQVLADRGFLISEDLANRGATLVIPSFTKGKAQLSAKEVELSRRIAHVRIHVERAIERLKNFNILSSNMTMHMVPHADSVVTICSALCNLQPKLVM